MDYKKIEEEKAKEEVVRRLLIRVKEVKVNIPGYHGGLYTRHDN